MSTSQERKGKPATVEANAEKETLHRAVLNSLIEGVLVTDLSGQVTWVNRTFVLVLQVSTEDIIGKTIREIAQLIAARVTNPEAFVKRVLESYDDPSRTTVEIIEFHGEKRLFVQETMRPLYNAAGEVVGRIFAYHDITREKEIDQMKTEFISIASHELRTPMTSIKGSLDLLLGGFAGDVSPDMRELLVIAQTGCDRLIRLINDILDISKIEAGRMQLKLAPINLLDSAERSTRAIKSYADSYNVQIEVHCSQPLPEVMADRDRMDQVITNLLSNAVKFSPPGGRVTVSLERKNDCVECCVGDQGQGIPPDQLERVFAKFHQVEGHEGRKGGTGLGLAIVRALIHEHHGRAWVESKLNEGSRFFFQIPRSDKRPAT